MAQLLVRNVTERDLRALKKRAGAHGVSAEEEHRRILREALRAKSPKPKRSLMEFLLTEGQAWPDDFEVKRSRDTNEHRQVKF